jgi:hypothetical protein
MKHRVGRVPVAFEELQRFAAAAGSHRLLTRMELTKKSSVTRCKNGLLTICLIYQGPDGSRGTHTIRGVKEAGRTK